jgi:2-aminoadipate transaminase
MPVYNFGAGNPDPGSFPALELAEASARVLSRNGAELVQYPDPKGHAPLRAIGSERFKKNNAIELPVENVALTTGSMQAISLVCQAYLQPGDTIVTEEYSYSGSINCFRKFGVEMEGIPVDAEGMNTDALEERLQHLDQDGRKPKFIYSIGTNQNPTGTMMPIGRRERLLEMARRYEVPVIDDDCYADLLFGEPAPTSMYALDPENVIYIGSFSKIMGPGMRLGYFAAKEETLAKVLYWKIDGGTNNFAAYVAAEYLQEHLWDHIDSINGIVKQKLDTVVSQLDSHTDVFLEHSNPKGGLFIWVKLPDDTDPNRILELATQRGVRYGTGKACHSLGQDIHYLRIAFGFASPDDFREGLPLLAECVREARAIPIPARN